MAQFVKHLPCKEEEPSNIRQSRMHPECQPSGCEKEFLQTYLLASLAYAGTRQSHTRFENEDPKPDGLWHTCSCT